MHLKCSYEIKIEILDGRVAPRTAAKDTVRRTGAQLQIKIDTSCIFSAIYHISMPFEGSYLQLKNLPI